VALREALGHTPMARESPWESGSRGAAMPPACRRPPALLAQDPRAVLPGKPGGSSIFDPGSSLKRFGTLISGLHH